MSTPSKVKKKRGIKKFYYIFGDSTYRYFSIFVILVSIGISCSQKERPSIIFGADSVSKVLFFESKNMTSITNIQQGNFDLITGNELAVLDQNAMHIIDIETGIQKHKIEFYTDYGALRPKVISSTENNNFKIMLRSGPVGLLNNNGKVLWTLNPDIRAYTMDNDEFEFYVASNKGLLKLDLSGKQIWKKNGLIYDVKVFERDKSNKPFICTVDHEGYIQFWDINGSFIKKIKPAIEINEIDFVDWPSPGHILAKSGSGFYILNTDGDTIFSHILKEHIFEIQGATVKLYNNQKPYFAVLADFSSATGFAMLCIFSPEKELFYKELINISRGLMPIKLKSSEGEILLVSNGPGKIYKYIPKPRRSG